MKPSARLARGKTGQKLRIYRKVIKVSQTAVVGSTLVGRDTTYVEVMRVLS